MECQNLKLQLLRPCTSSTNVQPTKSSQFFHRESHWLWKSFNYIHESSMGGTLAQYDLAWPLKKLLFFTFRGHSRMCSSAPWGKFLNSYFYYICTWKKKILKMSFVLYNTIRYGKKNPMQWEMWSKENLVQNAHLLGCGIYFFIF